MNDCVFCERTALREADVYIENEWCVYASSRDPTDPPDVLPGSGIIVPKAHRPSPFGFIPEERAATHDLLSRRKPFRTSVLRPMAISSLGRRFRPPPKPCLGCTRTCTSFLASAMSPLRDAGGRVGIKGTDNIRSDPSAPGSGWALLFGRHAIAGGQP